MAEDSVEAPELPGTEDGTEKNPRYDVAGWKERARASFGVSRHALAGALHGTKPGQRFTEAEVRKRLDRFEGEVGV